MTWDTPTLIAAAAILAAALGVVTFAVLRRQRNRGTRIISPYVEGLTHLISGDTGAAYDRLQSAVRSGNAPADAYIRLGRLLRERGDAGKALQIHKGLTVKADLTRSEKLDLFVKIAEDYAALGRSEQAVNVLDGAVSRLGLRDPSVQRLLARESHRMGRFDRAYNYLRELKKTGDVGDDELADYLARAGMVQHEEGKDREAKRTLHRALKHDPRCGRAHMVLGDIAELEGDGAEAIEHWRSAARLSAELAPRALSQLERVTFRRGNFSQMESIYRQVLEDRVDDEDTTLSLASFLRKQGRDEEAIRLLEEFNEAHPISIGVMALLARLYLHTDSDRLERFLQANVERFVHGVTPDEDDEDDTAEAESMPWR